MKMSRLHKRGIIFASLLLLGGVWYLLHEPNAWTRSRIESIVMTSAPPQQQLEALSPYVKVGENIVAVHQRIAPRPDEKFEVKRATEHAYGLGDANLILAILPSGKITGIGSHRYGIDDGTVWLAPPQW